MGPTLAKLIVAVPRGEGEQFSENRRMRELGLVLGFWAPYGPTLGPTY